MTALGAKLGERARAEPALLDRVRSTTTRAELDLILRESVGGAVPEALLAAFSSEVATDADWIQWRARLLLQAKLTRDGGKPAPGHESGRGVRKG